MEFTHVVAAAVLAASGAAAVQQTQQWEVAATPNHAEIVAYYLNGWTCKEGLSRFVGLELEWSETSFEPNGGQTNSRCRLRVEREDRWRMLIDAENRGVRWFGDVGQEGSTVWSLNGEALHYSNAADEMFNSEMGLYGPITAAVFNLDLHLRLGLQFACIAGSSNISWDSSAAAVFVDTRLAGQLLIKPAIPGAWALEIRVVSNDFIPAQKGRRVVFEEIESYPLWRMPVARRVRQFDCSGREERVLLLGEVAAVRPGGASMPSLEFGDNDRDINRVTRLVDDRGSVRIQSNVSEGALVETTRIMKTATRLRLCSLGAVAMVTMLLAVVRVLSWKR